MDFKVTDAHTDELKQKAFDIRKEVFVDEQKVAHHEEFDEYEDESHHFVAFHEKSNPLGTSRWRETKKGIKLERFAVKKGSRGIGVGKALVQATLDDIDKYAEKGTYLYMYSQLGAVPLYEKFGFQQAGDPFEECNILHYLMWKWS